jgi:hypothetical protein
MSDMAFVFQAVIIVIILVLARTVIDPVPADTARPFDTVGAILSAAGLVIVVLGILAADNNLIAMIVLAFIGLIGLGATFLLPAAEPAEPLPAPDTATSH